MDDNNIKLAEHLRFVHLTLVAVSITLLITIIEHRADGPSKDLNTILNLEDTFESEADNRLTGYFYWLIDTLILKKKPDNELQGTLKIADPNGKLSMEVKVTFEAPVATLFYGERE